MPDWLQALIDFLLADSGVAEQVQTRVYGGKLPYDEVGSQPQKVVVLRQAGGPAQAGYLKMGTERFDAFCFGKTLSEANAVRRAVHDALKQMERVTQGNVLLHTADVASGPVQIQLAESEWPCVIETWNVTASEVAVT